MSKHGNVSKAADQVEGHPVLQTGAKVGYAVSGVMHLLIGWIAFQVAWFSSGKTADQSGALQTPRREQPGTADPLGGCAGVSRPGTVAARQHRGAAH
jgi:Domain of Unknown Function (DUF1206)